MAGKRTTILDIAREVGMDYSTVSLALRRDPRIRTDTRERIQLAADRLGYMPNQLARSLSGAGTRVIGVLLMDMHHFFADPLEELQTLAEAANYTLSVHFSFLDHQREIRGLRRLCESRVEGIIWAPSVHGELLEQTAKIVQTARIPTVILANDPKELFCHQVGVPIEESLCLAIEHLVKYGHRKIAIATSASKTNSRGDMYRQRLGILRKIFARMNLPLPENMIFDTPDNDHGAIHIAMEMLKRPREQWPTAIFAADDMLTRGLLQAFNALGVSIPDQISLLGYDVVFGNDTDDSLPLTTVSLETRKMASQAMDLLMRHIKTPSAELPRQVILVPPCVTEWRSGSIQKPAM